MEDLRLFGLGKTQKDSGTVLRHPQIRENRYSLGGPRGQSWDPGIKAIGRQRSAQHQKKKNFGDSMDVSNCLETLCSCLLKMGDRNCSNTWRGKPELLKES